MGPSVNRKYDHHFDEMAAPQFVNFKVNRAKGY